MIAPPAPGDQGSVNQLWNEPTRVLVRTSLVVDAPDGRLPPLTPDAQRSQAARQSTCARTRPTHGRTETRGSNLQILQRPGYVVVIAEVVHETRVV